MVPIRVVDVHLDWCGPCEPMVLNYQKLWYTYDKPELRLSFFQCTESNLPDEVKADLKLDVSPRFLIYHKGELKR
jgi:hypothetical protein